MSLRFVQPDKILHPNRLHGDSLFHTNFTKRSSTNAVPKNARSENARSEKCSPYLPVNAFHERPRHSQIHNTRSPIQTKISG